MAAPETKPVRVEDFLENLPDEATIQQKPIDVDIDAGNILAVDKNELDTKNFKKNPEEFLMNYTRDNLQILINNLSQLPSEKKDEITEVKLPEPTTVLPREKVVPKAKQPTKWELFARMKGIQNKKKGRMVWDAEAQEYKPRWGYKRNDKTKSWLVEVPVNADPNEDQFEKLKKQKRESVAKNELQRLRNIARTTKSKVRGLGLTPTSTPSKQHLETALAVTHRSNASLGEFMEKLPKEKIRQKKRKFEANDVNEQEKQRKILKKISDKTEVLDSNRAANIAQHKEERQRAAAKNDDDDGGQRRKKAGFKGGKGGFKGGKGGFKGGKGGFKAGKGSFKGGKDGSKGGKGGAKGGKGGGKGGKGGAKGGKGGGKGGKDGGKKR